MEVGSAEAVRVGVVMVVVTAAVVMVVAKVEEVKAEGSEGVVMEAAMEAHLIAPDCA